MKKRDYKRTIGKRKERNRLYKKERKKETI